MPEAGPFTKLEMAYRRGMPFFFEYHFREMDASISLRTEFHESGKKQDAYVSI